MIVAMKTERIRINKTPAQPEGIEIELVKPENNTEGELLAFLLTGFVRDLKRDGRLPYELPERFGVRHQAEGSFILSGYLDEGKYYEPPLPLLIVGIQTRQGKFNLIHAPIQAKTKEQQQVATPMQVVQEPLSQTSPITAADEHPAT